MKHFLLFIKLSIVLFCISCNNSNKTGLELIVENDTITNSGLGNKNINIIKYFIRNNSDKIYYINNICDYKLKPNKIGVYSDGLSMYIFDQNDSEINYNLSHFEGSEEHLECISSFLIKKIDTYEKSLGYKSGVEFFRNTSSRNFFIHPKETIYFEYSIDLSGPIGYEDARIGYADLSTDKQYYAKISLASDSTTYKTSLPRDILKTIKVNKAEVFSGRIESVKIPIKFVK
ncbi:hypothetical protein QQY79_03995 [Flavobacterium tructae]|uniref:hypothetical protein n=1 Tax=Flavobacterium tructae TaxID=1114873 RepID=UPI0025520678|nr:hypothetical protein [Flavobacterium tructae]MDL2141671.1 hypothetical protein [Flavobacterium tructae]